MIQVLNLGLINMGKMTEDNTDSQFFEYDGDEKRELPELPKLAACEVCFVCGVKHYSRCHKCPHKDEIGTKYKIYDESPCKNCNRPSEHMANGHGKGLEFCESKYAIHYQPPSEIVSDSNYIIILDVLRAFSNLTPQEYYTFISVNYFSKTYQVTSDELAQIFHGKFNKSKIITLLNSAKEKLSGVISAGKIINGKLISGND